MNQDNYNYNMYLGFEDQEKLDQIFFDMEVHQQIFHWGTSVMNFIRAFWFCTGENNPEMDPAFHPGYSEYANDLIFDQEFEELKSNFVRLEGREIIDGEEYIVYRSKYAPHD